MASIQIRMPLFKQLIDAAKQYVAKDDSRHFLGFIRIEAMKGMGLVVHALTGYRAIRIKVEENCDCQVVESGVFYVRPLSFAVLPVEFVQLTADENATLITIPTQFGETSYKFKTPEWTVDLDKIFNECGPFEDKWTLNPEFLDHVKKACAGANTCDILIPENRLTSAVVKSKTSGLQIEQLMLPVRSV